MFTLQTVQLHLSFYLKAGKLFNLSCFIFRLFEIQSCSRHESSAGSFIAGEYLCTTTELQVLTEFDITFILAPLVESVTKQGSFVSLAEIQTSIIHHYPESLQESLRLVLSELTQGDIISTLQCICEHKAVASDTYLKFSRARYLTWLKLKFKFTCEEITKQNIRLVETPVASVVYELISSYITDESLVAELGSSLNVCAVEYPKPSAPVVLPPAKRQKIEPPSKTAPAGCQKISSFFKKV